MHGPMDIRLNSLKVVREVVLLNEPAGVSAVR